jgi:transketolase
VSDHQQKDHALLFGSDASGISGSCDKKGNNHMASKEEITHLEELAKLIRYYILFSTTNAGSGHPTSSLSATELMTALLFGGVFKFDADHPEHPNNDRLVFSKGHASPLFYGLWGAAGKLTEEDFMTYRKFGSLLEGHPTASFRYTEAATGSLGQGLSIGVGMAINGKYLDKLPYRTYVLLGDSEMAEGSQWESIQIAAHYKLDNLIGVLDVNRLGQCGETMYGHNLEAYAERISAFGWETIGIDGHSLEGILQAYDRALGVKDKPIMIIARTIKGKGISFLEDRNGRHGVVLKKDEYDRALPELGEVDRSVRGQIAKPEDLKPERIDSGIAGTIDYKLSQSVATRNAYGNALVRIFPAFPNLVSLDGEVSNSTMAITFKEAHPDRFFEMYVAEQNMVGAAVGLSNRGKLPFVSTFSAFMSRAYDQIRMSQYSESNIKFVGSHAGISIGQDGPSQMGLEDIAFFRTILDSVVLYPCDAVSTERLVEAAAKHRGIVYIRTTRMGTSVLYGNDEVFVIGGSMVLRQSGRDAVTVVAAGVTLHEALKAYAELKQQGIAIRVIDLYSIKPIDEVTLRAAAKTTQAIITVEDHYPEGGLGEAVRSALSEFTVPVYSLAVRKKPKSGKPEELMDYEGISQSAIVRKVKEII